MQRMQETWIQSLGLKDPLQPTSLFLPGKSLDQEAWWATVNGSAKIWTQLSDWAHTWQICKITNRNLPHSTGSYTSVIVLYLFSCITQHMGTSFPNQESNQCPLQWEHWVLTAGAPAKSRRIFSYIQFWFSVLPLNAISHYMFSQCHFFMMYLF